ncbi:hypothetical protein CBL_10176 [Carabus blaptoides fortunei]
MEWITNDIDIHICNACYENVQLTFDFLKMCRQNSIILKDYIAQLKFVSDSVKYVTNVQSTDESSMDSDCADSLVTEEPSKNEDSVNRLDDAIKHEIKQEQSDDDSVEDKLDVYTNTGSNMKLKKMVNSVMFVRYVRKVLNFYRF